MISLSHRAIIERRVPAAVHSSRSNDWLLLLITLCMTMVAVGTPVAGCPPHRSVLASLTHTALTLSTWRQSERLGMDAQVEDAAATDYGVGRTVAMSSDFWLYYYAVESPNQ